MTQDDIRIALSRLSRKIASCMDGQDACDTLEIEYLFLADTYEYKPHPASRGAH